MITRPHKPLASRIFIIVLAFLMSALPALEVSALDQADLYDFSQNNIYFYDPSENNRACYNGNLSGDTIMAKIVNYLSGNNPTNFVLSDNGIAGILTNFQHESGFNPFRFQGDSPSGPAYGIAQFDPKSKILEPLRTDPRTAGYFDSYYDLKYTKFDSSTGLPTESVPDEVIDAWLAVQMDYFFGSSSEFENTKVGSYRNKGGSMGLDYIDSGMSIHEAMDAAKTPEDATRIFVWIAERPAHKERDSNMRASKAQEWLSYVQSISTSSSSSNTDGTNEGTDGSNVTIIGDSITVGSINAIEANLPNTDIYAEVSKQFYTGTADNPGGIEILQSLIDQDTLRSTLVYALGTNSSITSEQAQEVVDLAGPDRNVVFVTNYTTSNDYDSNNNVFTKIKNDNENVFISDWKSAIAGKTDTYLASDGIHPTAEGQELFASIIASTIGASGDYIDSCGGAVEGGLTDASAQAVSDYYNGPEVDASYWGLPHGKMNCVSFSAFFIQRFTSVGRSPRSWGNGKEVAHNLSQTEGLPMGSEPRPFAVFSVTSGRTVCSDGYLCGHTGVVVAVNGNDVTTIEAAYRASDAKVKHHDISYFVNAKYGDAFVYTDSIINLEEVASIAGEWNE